MRVFRPALSVEVLRFSIASYSRFLPRGPQRPSTPKLRPLCQRAGTKSPAGGLGHPGCLDSSSSRLVVLALEGVV